MRVRVAAVLATLLAVASACGGNGTPKPPSSGGPGTDATSAAAGGALKVGDVVPSIESEAVEGPEVRLERFRGAPFILNFWASTCVPCKREFPLLRGILDRHSDFTIVGVAVNDKRDDARRFSRAQEATWPSIWDPDGSIAKQVGVRELPVTYAIGRNFRVVDRRFGEMDRNRLDSMVESVLRS